MAPTVGLCMIVKDETPRLERWAASVLPLIDNWTIVDTGSTDGTQEMVERLFADKTGTLHERPFDNFEASMNHAFGLVRDTCDYMLTCCDPDTTIEQTGPLPDLTADCYIARQRYQGRYDYWLPALMSTRLDWRVIGRTHSYWMADGATYERTDALVVHNHHDGNSGDWKWERDLRLLDEQIAEQPDDPRWVFYKAQTLAMLGRNQEAIDCYLRRVQMGGWPEEQFYAMWQAGALLINDQQVARGIATLLSAWEMRPTRAEPLHSLVQVFEQLGHPHVAALFDEQRRQLPMPAREGMNVHLAAYGDRA